MTARSHHTDDPDEAVDVFSRTFHPHRLGQARNGPLGFDLISDSVDTLNAGILRYGTEITAESTGARYYVAVPLSGTFRFEFGRVAVTADPTVAAIGTSGRPSSLRAWSTGDEELLVLGLDPDNLETHLSRLLARDATGPLNLSPALYLKTERGAQWWHIAQSIALALQSPSGLATHPMVSASLSSALMTGLLLAADHPHREALDAWTKPATPATIRRATEIIEQHAQDPLTIVDVADRAGCSVRALQIGFQKHLGTTPRDYIRRVRMDRAHTMLRFATPETATVAEIATKLGFNQLGRFAAQYRAIYGVTPRHTLHNR